MCVICTALFLSAPAPQSIWATLGCPDRDDMITAVWCPHCLVLVGASSTEQSGHLQVPTSRPHDQGCVPSALPCPCRRHAPQSSWANFRCHADDMITALCYLHCLVLVGVSFTEPSGHLQVPASRRHDQGCVLSALPCPRRRQLQRAVGPPLGVCIETT